MPLSQPTGLLVQTLEPLISVEQDVWRYNEGECFLATEAGDTLTTEAGDGIAPEEPCPETLFTFLQLVDDSATLYPVATLITLDQTAINYSDFPAQTLITLAQDVERHVDAATLVRFRQSVQAPGFFQPLRIYLDGNDITDRCRNGSVEITAGEGESRTAELSFFPPSGPIDVPSYQGRSLEITRLQNGVVVPLFTGVVDEPTYRIDRPKYIRLRCSDLRFERLGRESQSRIRSLTGGLYSPIVQRDDAEGEEWVRELMRTVSGSLEYTGAGSLRYTPWGVGTPSYTLGADELHHRSNSLRFSTRAEIVNRIKATLEYRYYQRNTFEHTVDLEMRRAEQGVGGTIGVLPRPGDIIPTKDALRSAVENVSGWRVMGLTYKPIAADGWYRYSASDTNKTAWTVNPVFRELRAMGVDALLERYISQPKRETYELTIEAPQSIEQYGEINGGSLRVSEETDVDPSIFEERGCVIIANPDDKRSRVEAALRVLQRIGEKQILEAHRQNEVNLRYKPGNGQPVEAQLLPLEIGQTIAINMPELATIGQVVGFTHIEKDGDRWTDFSLAISQVDSDLEVTEDWSLPAQPSTYKLSATATPTMTPDCPLPADEVEVEGVSRIEPDGTVYVVTPSISRGQVDEIIGTRKHTYSVEIPRDQFTVEVP